VFALRMSNDRDQEIVTSAITDSGSGLLEFLPALGQREALAFGDGVALPVRIKFDQLPPDALPRSTTAHFTEHWQQSVGDEGFLEHVVEKWRTSDIGAGGDPGQHAAMLAEGMTLEQPPPPAPQPPPAPEPPRQESALAARMRQPEPARAGQQPRQGAPARKESFGGTAAGNASRAEGEAGASGDQAVPGAALKSLRDRLIQRQQR
jgi:hypothetical protein